MKFKSSTLIPDPHTRTWLIRGFVIFMWVLTLPFLVAGLVRLLVWLIHVTR